MRSMNTIQTFLNEHNYYNYRNNYNDDCMTIADDMIALLEASDNPLSIKSIREGLSTKFGRQISSNAVSVVIHNNKSRFIKIGYEYTVTKNLHLTKNKLLINLFNLIRQLSDVMDVRGLDCKPSIYEIRFSKEEIHLLHILKEKINFGGDDLYDF